MKEEPELICLNLILVDVKSESGDYEICQRVFYKMHINSLFNGLVLIPDVQLSTQCKFTKSAKFYGLDSQL